MNAKSVIFLLLAACISACATIKLTEPTQVDAERGSQKFPGYSMNDLAEGKKIYEANCNKCHRYKVPESRDEAKWDDIIPKMAKKAKLSSDQQELVLKYVVTMSTAKSK
ncbi:MAG: hypothetical protein ABUT20_56540 [Bacteroidota bacterium]